MGLVILVAMGLYLLISVGVVAWAIRYARKSGKSATRWGCGALLVMYLIPCWDWIPTVATHQYYCAKDSGFWIYKTVEQWKTENPGELEKLSVIGGAPKSWIGDMNNFTDTYSLNQRINRVLKKNGPILLNQWRWEQTIVDSKTNELLARSIGFSSGNGKIGGEPPNKFWLQSDGCGDGNATNDSQFKKYYLQFLARQ